MKHLILALAPILFAFTQNVHADLFSDTLFQAKNSNSNAAYQVANMLLIGNGVAPNREQAIEWLEKAADQGHPKAVKQLAKIMLESRKFNILEKLAEIDDIDAQFALADAYTNGIGVTKDLAIAMYWYDRASAAQPNQAQRQLSDTLTKYSEKNSNTNRGTVTKIETSESNSQQLVPQNTSVISNKFISTIKPAAGQKKDVVLLPARSQNQTKSKYQLAATDNNAIPSDKIVNLNQQQHSLANRILVAEADDENDAEESSEDSYIDEDTDESDDEQIDIFSNLLQEFVSDIDEQLESEILDEPAIKPVETLEPTTKMLAKPPISTQTDKQEHEAISTDTSTIINSIYLGIEYLLGKNWTRNGKPTTYLPSLLTQCNTKSNRIICNSHMVKDKHMNNSIQYKSKSIITDIDGSRFLITYRNLVLESIHNDEMTETTSSDEDEELGNDNQSQNFQTKTGWTKKHILDCHYTGKESIHCVKNGHHSIDITVRNY